MRTTKICARCGPIQGILAALVILCFVQCKESDRQEGITGAYDPSKPVVVTDFLPKEGGSGSNMVIYGDNFGHDPSRVKVVIGGKDAKVINVKGNTLYCIVPPLAVEGSVKVAVLDEAGEDELASGNASETFVYIKKWIVSDFAGRYYEVANQREEKEGPFHDCGGFNDIVWFSFDPKNPDHLYFVGENASARKLDLAEEYAYYFPTPGIGRKTTMTWKIDGNQDMIVPENHASDTRNAFYTFSRSSNFTASQVINQVARGVNGAAVHPTNGEMYYSLYRAGEVRRHDFITGENKLSFANPFTSTAIYIVIHPSGEYAYITNLERHYILRSNYDPTTKNFLPPYPIAGMANTAGWADGVGTSARMNRPVQGVFVKNPEYEEQDGDQYDYYFCDRNNHAIRRITPQGRVSTFAGRGNNGTNGYANGDIRLEARFDQPAAIAYDETRKCFYVGEAGNKIIRKIAIEEE